MAGDLIAATSGALDTGNGARNVPTLVVRAGGDAQKRFIEFFAALRRLFKRLTGVSPGKYRDEFALRGNAPDTPHVRGPARHRRLRPLHYS